MKVTLKEKMSYGIGTLGYCLENAMINGYLILYSTEVLGINAAIIGALLLIPKFLDIVTDVLIMNLVDKINPKFGKYKTWLFSAIPIAICLVLLFLNPSFLHGTLARTLWVLIIYFFTISIFETAYWCPYATMSTVISNNSEDTMELAAFRSIFENIAAILVSAITMPLVLKCGTSYKDSSGWLISVLIFAVIGIICMIICFLGVKERIQINNKKEKLKEKIKILKNKPMIKLIIIMICSFISIYTYTTLFSYFCIYSLGHEEWIASLSIIGILTAIITGIISPRITHKIGEKKMIMFSSIVIILSLFIFYFANNYYLLVIFFIIKNFGQTSIYICEFAYIPKLTNYIDEKMKINSPGLVLGVISAFQKIAGALGVFIATIILAIGGYNEAIAVQGETVGIAIKMGIIILYFVPTIIILLVNKNFKELEN